MSDSTGDKDPYPYASYHARLRIAERYDGLTPTEDEWRTVFLDILEGRVVLLSSNAHYERYLCSIRGVAFFAIYSPGSAKIVTVLPQGHVTKSGRFVRTLRMRDKPQLSAKGSRQANAPWKLMLDADEQ